MFTSVKSLYESCDNRSMKNVLIGICFILLILIVGVTSFYLYKKTEVDSRLTKVDSQIVNLLNLEQEIYENCLDGKIVNQQNVEICEDSTQKELARLTAALRLEKQELESLSVVDTLNY